MTRRTLARTALGTALLSATLALSAACDDTRGRLYVRVGPPAPVYESRIVSPGTGYVWVDGYHRWDGGGYVWVAGRWERPPRPRAVWVRPHWEHDRRGYFFVEGYWR